MESRIHNINVVAKTDMPTPEEVKQALPLDAATEKSVVGSRRVLQDILDGRDARLFAVVGPCSIHDIDAARDYAGRLKLLADEVADTIVILMRVYFEKPRTTVGWKGLINDPDMDDSFNVEKGIGQARELLLHLSRLGLP
ncbi:MAG: 3-deoxy-7-phosphoheptulonate synthase, partial [Gammaproteobacteria bacterium]|nr:3-deoxy-7-phosphoheptulonate synthase [Gammaproteobacteria bacterium]